MYFQNYIKQLKEVDIVVQMMELKILNVYYLLLRKPFTKQKIIFWSHGWRKKGLNVIFKWLMSLPDAIVLYTPFNKKDYLKYSKKLFIANNSLYFREQYEAIIEEYTQNKDRYKKELGLEGKRVGLFCGRLYKKKNVDLIIRVFQKLGDKYALLIIGDGDHEGELKRLANNSKSIHFLGKITEFKKKAKYFAAADVGFLSGVMGLNIVDYFSWGLPLIGLEGDHPPEIFYLKDGKNGFYCKDENDMYEKAKHLMSDPQMVKSFANKAYNTYKTEANMDVMMKGFTDAIKFVNTIK